MWEYILVYAKNKQIWRPNKLQLNSSQKKYYTNPDNDPRGLWNSSTYTCNKSKTERPNLYYPIINPNTGDEVWPKETAVWKYSQDQTILHQQHSLLYWGSNGQAKFPRFKKYIYDHDGVVPRTLWHYDDVGHTQGASSEINRIIECGFPTPKPSKLIERIIQIASEKDSIVLDSFAGSGTTAHAVLNLNKIDGGNRKFILVEMDEYAETITAERVRRVMAGYSDVEGTGGDFSYYELGVPLMTDVGQLNETVSLEKIREYVFFMETRTAMTSPVDEKARHEYFMGSHNFADYYFYYEKDRATVLNHAFVATIKDRAERYVIYADKCLLSDGELDKCNIIFKKIPRDIARL